MSSIRIFHSLMGGMIFSITCGDIMDDDDREWEIGMMQMDGYDDCVVGTVTRFGISPVLCYDLHKVIAKMVADGMDEEEAYEYYNFNMLGAWVGEGTPAFICYGQHDYYIENEENVDDQENIRRIMESSFI